METKRVHFFVAHPKSYEDAELDILKEEIRKVALKQLPHAEVTITLGRDDFMARAAAEGGWRGWSESVVTARKPSGAPRFDAIIVPPGPIGRATADMLRLALVQRRPVLRFLGDDFRPVSILVERDRESWKDGWELR